MAHPLSKRARIADYYLDSIPTPSNLEFAPKHRCEGAGAIDNRFVCTNENEHILPASGPISTPVLYLGPTNITLRRAT
jgi:hypothetical protein